VLTSFIAAKSGSVMAGARPPMKIWAWAPGTFRASRVAEGAGAPVVLGSGTGAEGSAPKRRSARARTSAALTLPLTASTIPPGT
jgi:hypothetical protein